MNKRHLVAGILGRGVVGLGAQQVLSFEVTPEGVKSIAHGVIATAGERSGLGEATVRGIQQVVGEALDGAHPILGEGYAQLSALESGDSSPAEVLGGIQTTLGRLIDLKDRIQARARETLSPVERARVLVAVMQRVRERGLDPEEVEARIEEMKALRKSRTARYLGWDPDRVEEVAGVVEPIQASRDAMRQQRRDLVGAIEELLDASHPSEEAIAEKMAEWDALHAKGSEIARSRLAALSSVLTPDEKIALARRAKDRIDRVARFLTLVGIHRPVR